MIDNSLNFPISGFLASCRAVGVFQRLRNLSRLRVKRLGINLTFLWRRGNVARFNVSEAESTDDDLFAFFLTFGYAPLQLP
jgi:hypothetical protein